MELSRHERLQSVVKWLAAERGVNQRDIGELLGWTSPVASSQLLNGKKTIPEGLPARLAALDPRINIDFLTGISDQKFLGEDVLEHPEVSAPVKQPRVGIFIPPELAQMVTDLTALMREQQATIREQQSTIREQQNMVHKLVDSWVKKES